MIRLFNVHVPIPCIALAVLDTIVLYAFVQLGLDTGVHSASLFDTWPELTEQNSLFLGALLVCLFMMGVYRRPIGDDMRSLAARIVIAFFLAFCLMTSAFYIRPADRIWMSALFPALFGSLIWLLFSRGVLRNSLIALMRSRVLVLGCGPQARKLEVLERQERSPRFTCVGFVQTSGSQVCVARAVDRREVLEACLRAHASEIVVALEDRRNSLPIDTLLECRSRGIPVMSIESFIEREIGQVDVDSLHPSWLIFSNRGVNRAFTRATKRLLDVLVSIAILIFTLPVTVATALAILLEDGFPIFYTQERVALYGNIFRIVKFRSMRKDAERDGIACWAAVRDLRITHVGSVTRKMRLDELPQVWNVLKGEMSLVGPRPERPAIIADLADALPFYEYRHLVKPGITGWAQINYGYGNSLEGAKEKLKYDLYYVKNFGLLLDIVILLQTARVILWPRGVH